MHIDINICSILCVDQKTRFRQIGQAFDSQQIVLEYEETGLPQTTMANLSNKRLEFMLMICLSDCWLKPVESRENDLFQRGPGQSKVYLGDEVSLVWILTQPLDLTAAGSYMEIYHSNTRLLRGSSGGCDSKVDSRLSCITQGTSVGFSIMDVQLTDARSYRCQARLSNTEGTQSNVDASVYIYRAPSTPTIIGNTEGVVGVTLTLQCSATSQSLPESERPSDGIEYIWSTTLPHTASGNTVKVGPLTRDHDGETVTCTANEQGSTLTSEKTVTISVIYPPGSAQLQTNKTTVVQGTDDLVMTCQVSPGEEGKPNTYTYQWRNPKQQASGSGISLTIHKNTLDADLHDGTWQCTPSNTAGSGTPGTKTIMVNAAPSLEPNGGLSGPYEVPIDGSLLLMSCSFKAKPKAVITWKYNGGTSLPAEVGQSSSDAPQGKYYITTSRLRWEGSESARKASGGQYECVAGNGIGQNVQSGPATLLPLYGPDAASLTPAGPLTINEPDMRTITCQAACSKACSFSWTKLDNATWSHSGASLVLSPSNRAEHGTFVCTAMNNLGQKQAQIQISVNFHSTIKRFDSSHQGDLVPAAHVTLTCDVESQPSANMQLVHVDSGTKLVTISSENKLQHTLTRVDCFVSGTYECRTNNSIWTTVTSRQIMLNVLCSPSAVLTHQDPVAGRLHNSFTYQIPIVANPVVSELDVHWLFQATAEQLKKELLPDSVETSVGNTNHPLIKNLTIYIGMILNANFGTYTVTASNQYGTFSSQVNLLPERSPDVPSKPLFIKSTAVSIEFCWTAGFDGGWPQTFTVLYRSLDTNEELSVVVDHQTGVTQGDVIVHKLKDTDTILPASLYMIRIQASNEYKEGNAVFGDSALFETKERPELQTKALVEFITNHVVISLTLTNVESISHLTATVCPATDEVMSSCGEENTTISAAELTITIKLLGKVGSYKITLQMYDGEDIVNSKEWISDTPKKLNAAAIVGGVLGALLLACVLIIIVLLWRKGILNKSSHQADTRMNKPVVVYENVAHAMSPEAGTNGGTFADTLRAANDNSVTADNITKTKMSGFTLESTEVNYEKLTDDYAPRLEPTVYEEMVL